MSGTGSAIDGEVAFGLFWQVEPEGNVKMHHAGLIKFLRSQGFFWLKTDDTKRLCREVNRVVEEADITDITNFVYKFIESDKVPDKIEYGVEKRMLLNCMAKGIVNYINFPKLRLLPIKELQFHFDTKEACFFYFNNGVVRITEHDITLDGYSSLKQCVWKRQRRPYSFTLLKPDESQGEFETFCFRVCNEDNKRFEGLQTVIGYLLHRYWHASQPVIPCLLDETTIGTEQAEGGTGKTLICQALGFVRNMVDIDGKTFNPEGSFAYQRVNMDSEILFVDDLDRRVSFESWFSVVTTGLEINQKNKPAFKIQRERTPKIVITSNFPIKSVAGRSTERRKVEFECSQHYGTVKPADEFGHEFFTEWDAAEFNRMFNFFARCVQSYLKNSIITPPSANYGLRQLISTISVDLKEFLDEKMSTRTSDMFNKKDLYSEFLSSYPGQKQFYPSPHRFTLKVHRYLQYHNVQFVEVPANKKTIIEVTDWGDIPVVSDDAVETETYKTLSDTAHDYQVVDTPAATVNTTNGRVMSFAEAMGEVNTSDKKDEPGTTAEPVK